MLMTGHTQINTLRKYLGYGRQLTAEGAEAQGNAVLLHPEQSNSETERRAPRTSRPAPGGPPYDTGGGGEGPTSGSSRTLHVGAPPQERDTAPVGRGPTAAHGDTEVP
eukprot:gene12489-biopygen9048